MTTEKQTQPANIDVLEQDGFWLDDEKGSGSRDQTEDWVDESAIIENDGRSKTRTAVGYSGEVETDTSPEERWRLRRLRSINDGVGDSDRKQQNNEANVRRDTKAYTDYLRFTGYQRDRALYIIDKMDYSSQNYGGVRVEKIIIAVCSFIHDEEVESLENRATNSERFVSLMDTVCESDPNEELSRVRDLVREKCSLF